MAVGKRAVLFSLVVVCLFFVVLELFARSMGQPKEGQLSQALFEGRPPNHYSPDPDLGWRHKPGVTVADPVYEDIAKRRGDPLPPPGDLPISPEGFRDTPLIHPKPEGQVRVLCLGDSSVFGVGAPRTSTYSERLERALNPSPLPPPAERTVEVINTGVSGYSSFQSLFLLKSLDALDVDIVIVYNMNSDLMTARGFPDAAFFNPALMALRSIPLEGLYFYRWMKHTIQERRRVKKSKKAGEGALRVRLKEYRSNIQKIIKYSRAGGADVILVIPTVTSDIRDFPPQSSYWVDSPESASNKRKMIVTAENATEWWAQERSHYRMVMSFLGYHEKVPVVDGAAATIQRFRTKPLSYWDADPLFADELHPSAAGHGVLAEAILPVLKPLVEKRQ